MRTTWLPPPVTSSGTRGYAATSVDDLTAATGLGKGSLYGAFGDKHSLYLRALDDYIASSLGEVRATLRDPAFSATDRLARHIRGQVKLLAADKSSARLPDGQERRGARRHR